MGFSSATSVKPKISGVDKKGGFPNGWFWRMFPERNRNEGYIRMFPPERKTERGHVHMFPQNENRNEGTFAKTTLNYETALVSPSENCHQKLHREAGQRNVLKVDVLHCSKLVPRENCRKVSKMFLTLFDGF